MKNDPRRLRSLIAAPALVLLAGCQAANVPDPEVSSIEEAAALLQPTYVRTLPVRDGWGNRYHVETRKNDYVIVSYGQDGRSDGLNPWTCGPEGFTTP